MASLCSLQGLQPAKRQGQRLCSLQGLSKNQQDVIHDITLENIDTVIFGHLVFDELVILS
jgi:hypothetical protein